MAIKTPVKEICERCGKVNGVAVLHGIRIGHLCDNPVPGPPPPPVVLPWRSAYLVHPNGATTTDLSPEDLDQATFLEPYRQQAIAEKQMLDEKAEKLSQFIGNNPEFEKFDEVGQELLKEQCEIMWQYSEILGKRIEAFPF